MRKYFLKIFAILILVILQLTLFSKLEIFSSIPNLIFIISIVLLLRQFRADAFLVGAIGGVFLDLASPLRFGIYTLVLLSFLLLINFFLLKGLSSLNPILIFGFFAFVFLILDLLIFAISRTLPAWQILIDAFLNACLAIVAYWLSGRILRSNEEIKLM